MREIKFRAWDKAVEKYRDWKWINNALMFSSILESENWIVEQFSGLIDKNGKKIYEGDILSFNEWVADNPEIMQSAPVVWYQEKCCFIPQSVEENNKGGHFIHHWDFIGNITVIGNIHENPELLTGHA